MEQKGLDFGGGEKKAEAPRPAPRKAWTVTQLTERIRGALEVEFFDVWVEGEVSNLKAAASGHWYFSLKDENSQIQAVLWKSAARLVKFKPRDGLKVLARGSLGVFAPRGEYRLSVEVLEPLGKGSLQQAFEELKERLEKEGLFAPARKRPLPALPRRIAIVTSPVGAVIQDILRVLSRRYGNLEVLIYPARMQGAEAAAEIVQGLRALNKVKGLDVVIVARGGGSLEDLWPFNEERVAHALAACTVPTISAVGHETDFTIADFLADVRAPTPSAAAELVIEAKADICARIDDLARRVGAAARLRMTRVRARVAGVTSHRVFAAERGRIRGQAQRVDDLARRAETGLVRQLERARERMRRGRERTEAFRWDRQLQARRDRVRNISSRLAALARSGMAARRAALGRGAAQLESLSPLSVLSRGYALVWDERGRLLRDPAEVEVGDALAIRVHAGRLRAAVFAKETG